MEESFPLLTQCSLFLLWGNCRSACNCIKQCGVLTSASIFWNWVLQPAYWSAITHSSDLFHLLNWNCVCMFIWWVQFHTQEEYAFTIIITMQNSFIFLLLQGMLLWPRTISILMVRNHPSSVFLLHDFLTCNKWRVVWHSICVWDLAFSPAIVRRDLAKFYSERWLVSL